MKKHLLFVMAFLGMWAFPALGQNARVKANVPFPFVVGDRIYAAGDYEFASQKETVIMERSDGTRVTTQLANRVSGNTSSKTGDIVFECYDDQCFLSQVWVPGLDNGSQLLRSPLERRVAAKKSAKYMALMGMK
jgi:hypothetical protein